MAIRDLEMMIKTAIIRKLPDGKYRLYSRKKGPDGQRRNLGTYTSRAGAEQREKEVQTFKHMADDKDDKETKMLRDLSGIAKYLEEAGFTDKADKIYVVMSAIDSSLSDNLADHTIIPDDQRNIENQGYAGGESPIGGGYGMLGVDEAQRSDDKEYNPYKELYEMKVKESERLKEYVVHLQDKIDKLYYILEKVKEMYSIPLEAVDPRTLIERPEKEDEEQDNVDAAVRSNGLRGITVTDDQNAGSFQGFSDSYFYRGYGNLEGVYGPQNR